MIDKSQRQIKNELGVQIQENSDQLKDIKSNLDKLKNIQSNLDQLKKIQKAQNFQIGDILMTTRDLSANNKWINCSNPCIDLSNYPELREVLKTQWNNEKPWKTEKFWRTKNFGSELRSFATNNEWYLVLSSNCIYYTRDPNTTWTKKDFEQYIEYLISDGTNFAAFFRTDYKYHAFYTNNPEEPWTLLKDIFSFGYDFNISWAGYINGTYLFLYSTKYHWHQSDKISIESGIYYNTSLNNQFKSKKISRTIYENGSTSFGEFFDFTAVSFCNNQWLIAIYQRNKLSIEYIRKYYSRYTSSAEVRLYYADKLDNFNFYNENRNSDFYSIDYSSRNDFTEDASCTRIMSIAYVGGYYFLSSECKGKIYFSQNLEISRDHKIIERFPSNSRVLSFSSHSFNSDRIIRDIKYYKNEFMFITSNSSDTCPILYSSTDLSHWTSTKLAICNCSSKADHLVIDNDTDNINNSNMMMIDSKNLIWCSLIPNYNSLYKTAYIKAKEGV